MAEPSSNKDEELNPEQLSGREKKILKLKKVKLIGQVAGLTEEQKATLLSLGVVEHPSEISVSRNKDHHIDIGITVPDNGSVELVAKELATLCRALNAYHIALGGNGLEIDDWETLIAVRELVGV